MRPTILTRKRHDNKSRKTLRRAKARDFVKERDARVFMGKRRKKV
jgi:hypothetical protein